MMGGVRMLVLLTILAAGLFVPTPSFAVNPDEILQDPGLEARAREISKGLRCVVCRNQSIDDSNAEIAREMRIILRERLLAGESDEEAAAFLVQRFGMFILLKPPVVPMTYLLWAGPAILLLAAIFGFSRVWGGRVPQQADGPALTDEDQALAASLLQERLPR